MIDVPSSKIEYPRSVTVFDHFDVPMEPDTEDGKETIAMMNRYVETGVLPWDRMTFDSQMTYRGRFTSLMGQDFTQDVIKNEPMFFNADIDFAYEHGGPITRAFLTALPQDWVDCNPVIDSRVHMLMKGWFPCIPGWHHDDIPRSTKTGQPNYLTPEYKSEHLMGLVNGDICPTRFLLGKIAVPVPDENGLIYKNWSEHIEQAVAYPDQAEFKFNLVNAPSNRLIEFNHDTFHTGVRAVADGWRWFIRLSRNTDRQTRITNEIRRQVQVYLEFPTEGW